MDLSDLPVTLVIKAPNQRIADQTIECMAGWTVKKLKKHLESAYPSNPKETQQRLIYAGRLLLDHLQLKDFLMPYDEKSKHTLHLVCSPSVDKAHQEKIESQEPNSMLHSVSSPSLPVDPEVVQHDQRPHIPHVTSTPQFANDQEGLRYRGFHRSDSESTLFGSPVHQGMYSPEQIQYMQQMYAQYMTQYMQYYQMGGMYQTHPMSPTTPSPDVSPAPQNLPANNPPPNQPQRQENQNIRMNAQGGADMDDDDDEFGHRDWLDWIYTMCRFLVLLSIVYFYSTLHRFMVVTTLFFFVYLYQAGWLRLARRQAPNEGEEQQNAEQQQDQPPEPEEQDPGPQEQETPQQNTSEVEGTSEVDSPEETNTEPPLPGTLSIVWCFLTTFFTSLLPQPPAAVNAN